MEPTNASLLWLWLMLFGVCSAESICDYPDALVGPNTTARQYCTKMNRLNLLLVIPGAVVSYRILQSPPTGRAKPVQRFYRYIIFGRSDMIQFKGDPPSDPALFGLQVLFHTLWMLTDFRYPSSVAAGTSTAFLVTYPIIPIVSMLIESKHSLYISTGGPFWTLYWLGAVSMQTFPRLNWTMWGVDAFKETKFWSTVFDRISDSRVFATISPWMAANIIALFILGLFLLLRTTDDAVPVCGYIDPATRILRVTSIEDPSQNGKSSQEIIDESITPTSAEASDIQLMSDRAYALQGTSGRFVGYYGPGSVDLSSVGYGFILFSVILFLIFVQRNNNDLDSGTESRALKAIVPALFVTAVSSLVLSTNPDRSKHVKLGLRAAAVYCGTWMLIQAGANTST